MKEFILNNSKILLKVKAFFAMLLMLMVTLSISNSLSAQDITIAGLTGGVSVSPLTAGTTNHAILGFSLSKAGGGPNSVTQITISLSQDPSNVWQNPRLYRSMNTTFESIGIENLVASGTLFSNSISFSSSPLTNFSGASAASVENYFVVVDINSNVSGSATMQASLTSMNVTASNGLIVGNAMGTNYNFTPIATTIGSLNAPVNNVATSPLIAGATNQAIFGFSLTSTGTQTLTALNVSLSEQATGIFNVFSLVRSSDADFATTGDNTTIGGLNITWVSTEVFITGLNEILTTTPTNYFLVVSVESGVTSFTPSVQATLNAGNVTVNTGIVSGLITGTNYSFLGPPNAQAASIVFSNVSPTSITATWSNGNGANRLVLVKAVSAVDATPVNGQTYSANTTFGSGTQLGTGNYVVYSGTGNSVTVTGLNNSTVYYFRVFEFNGSGANTLYYTSTSSGNPANQITNSIVGTTTVTYNTSGSFDVPAGISSITVEAWGAGGAGGGSCGGCGSNNSGGGGGGGGAYSKSTISVIPSQNYFVTVGTGGLGMSGGNGFDGGDSWFGSTSTILAKGGTFGSYLGTNGIGGQASNGIGGIKYSGGNGGTGQQGGSGSGGGGGSSAGTASDGLAGSNSPGGGLPAAGGAAVAGGGEGGVGVVTGNGFPGGLPGGGGGGSKGDPTTGGAGANGKVVITYTQPTVTINQAGAQTDPTGTLPVQFTVVFSEAINPATFTGSDITLGGTATGQNVSGLTTSDNITYTLSINASGGGTIIPSIAASVVSSAAGNANLASSSTDNTVTYNASSTGFITTWVATDGTITIPTTGGGYNYSISWTNLTNPGVGEGSVTGQTSNYTITGLQFGSTYRVSISGDFPRIYLAGLISDIERTKIKTIEQWGDIAWTSMEYAFQGGTNLTITATDIPDLSAVTDLSFMFVNCAALTTIPNINAWDVSNVTNMSAMFQLTPFNSPVTNWNVINVTDMSAMFAGTLFNGDLSSWNVSNVTNMAGMFNGSPFNGDLSSWDVSNVTNMAGMFGSSSFSGDLSSWDVSSVTNMASMFGQNTAFNSDLSNWNVSNVTDMGGMFGLATSFSGDLSNWDVSSVTSMYQMFWAASAFNGNLSSWNVSSVTNMERMFWLASSFNSDLSGWNVGNVTTMAEMFHDATSFNSDLSNWDVSNVINMSLMFYNATSFNSDLSGWDVSNVTNMSYMFGAASAFNGDLSSWDVSSVTNMQAMFVGVSSFTSNLGGWDVGNVTDMQFMLSNSGMTQADYDATLIGWSTLGAGETQIPSGITLGAMGLTYCAGATARQTLIDTYGWTFEADSENCGSTGFITTWVTTDGTITIPTTGGGYNYSVTWTNLTNPGVAEGSVSGQTSSYTINGLQNGSTYRVSISGDFPRIYFAISGEPVKIQTIEQWGDIVWTSMNSAFLGCSNLTITAIDVPDLSGVTDLSYMFQLCNSITTIPNINSWDVSNVTNMRFMFDASDMFNSDLSNWDVSSVTDMSYMFQNANAFNSNLSNWNVSNVTNMQGMFYGASSFTSDLSNWDVSSVTDMLGMFGYASSFNSNLSNWNVSSVTVMGAMFEGASSFNSDLSNWNVSSVTNMNLMFQNAGAFNSDLSGWNVSNVTEMGAMFSNADSFNSDLSGWNVGNVTYMASMFYDNNSFNSDLSGWDVSSVTDMSYMFHLSSLFNQELSNWNVGNVTNMSEMLSSSGMTQASYDATLIGWATLGAGETQIPSGITLGADGLTYCAGAAARQALIDTYGWTITGDTGNCGPTVTSVSSAATDGIYGVGAIIPITVTFNIAVDVVGTPTITLETGSTDRVVNYSSGTGTTTLTFNYTVQAGDVSADLDYLNNTALALNGGTIKDAGNVDAILTLATPAAAGSLGANKAIVIDGVVPLAPSAPDLATADDFGLSNTDNITSLDAGLTLTGTAEAGALVTFTEAGLGVLGSVTATGGNYSFDFDIGSGTYNITATAQDIAGNTSVASGNLTITVDTGNPTVTINQSGSQADPTSLVPVSFDIVFNKAINPATFTMDDITLGGTAPGQSVTSLTSSDNITWILLISATDAGTIIPSLLANTTEDVAGNSNIASSSTDNIVDYISCVNPVLALSSNPNTFCVGGNGSATVDTIDGIPNPAGYTYQWFTGTDTSSPIPSATNATANNLIGGDYTVEVTHTITGCSSTSTITVPDLGGPYTLLTTYTVNQPTCTVSTASVDFTDLPTSSWTITASPSGTTLNGTTATATFSGLPAGATYTFFLRDNVTGCTIAETSPEVIDPAPVSPALTPSTTPNTACDVNYNGGLSITAITSSGEPGGYSYVIATGPIGTYPTSGSLTGSTLTLSDLPPGNYSIDITNNDNTCTTNTALTINDNPVLPDITLGTSPSVVQETTTASLPYTSTTGTPDQYAIDFDATAEAQGFADVVYTTLPVSPVAITVPAAAIAASFNATLTVRNSTNACVSVNKPFTVQVTGAAPVITAVAIPNVAMKIGDIVTATITVNSSTETFTLPGGSTIGGFALSGLIKVNNTTYTANFTIISGGTDVAAGSNIPVNMILNGTGGNSTAFTTAIVQASDPIDANAPAAPSLPDLATADDTGTSSADNITNLTSALTFAGTAESGATVNLYRAGTTLIGTGVATGGLYSIDVTLPAGDHTITATATDVAGNTGTSSAGLNVTVDTTPPAVTINQAVGQIDPTGTVPVTFTVVFSEAVVASGFLASDITLGGTAAGQSVSNLTSVDNITWTLVITATGAGTISPALAPSVANDFAGNSNNASTSTDNSVTYNPTVAPVITAITIPNVSMKIGDVVTATITVNSSTETFTLAAGSTIGGFSLSNLVKSDNTTYTAQFTITDGGTDVAAGNNIPVSITLNGSGGNSTVFTTAIAQASDPIDANAPLFSTTAPATNATISNTQVSYTLSETLASGSITWTRTGGTADAGSPHVLPLSGSELTAGIKTNITLGNNPALVIGAVYSISFSGADAAGNAAAIVTNTNISFNIDATPPTIVSINYQTPSTSPTNATSLTFRAIFSETVTGVAAADFTPTTTGVTIGALSVTAVNGTTYDVTIASVTGNGTVRLDVLNTATITDAASNAYASNFTTGQVYTVDQTAPVFSATTPISNSTVTNANVSYTLSEALASGTITWTRTGGTADANSPHAQTLTGAELTAGAKTNITLGNNPTLVNGTIYSISFSGADAAGNVASPVTNTNILFNNDTTAPTVTTINLQTPATSPTNATSVTFRITFSETVLNVDAADFTKTLTGVSGGAITVTAINGTTYDATFTVAGSGTVRLDILSSATITDALGNAYASNFTSGQVYTIDQTPPLFSATGPASNTTVTNTEVSYTLSENLSNGTITWTRTGGTADAGSPHVQSLTGSELNVGPHTDITLTNNPVLVAGAAYTIAFNGTDLAGNASQTVTETNVNFAPNAGSLSDIVASASFTYPQNINYASFQEASDIQNSATSINVARFDIRDGGATGDADPFPTILTGFTLDIGSNFSVIRRIALYHGSDNSELAGTDQAVSSQRVSFSNLTLQSEDNASSSFIVRVSFAEAVTDNVQFSFTVTAASSQAGNSGFVSSNAGGAASSSAGNNNRIEVVATKLNFVQQPSNIFVNGVMSPAVTIEAIDEIGNRDLDFSGSVGFTSTGTLSSAPTAACASGFGVSSDMIFSSAGTGIILTTSNSAGLINATSTSFDIFDDPEAIALVIKSILTPNTADDQNNVLHIENIEFFPENMVRLIDRWGVPIKSWANFSNYTTPDAEQPDFNFNNLDIGNYICVVEYINPANGTKKSQTQMITVLK